MADTKKSIYQRLLLGEIVDRESGVVTNTTPTSPTQQTPTEPTDTATTEYQRLLGAPAAITQVPKKEVAALPPEQQQPIAIRDLYSNDAYQKTMRDYLKLYAGEAVEGLSNEEVADKYVNRMRSWNAGNSMTVVEEVYDLARMGDKEREVAGNAYKLFDSMGNIFGKQASWGDTFDGLYDYAYSTIVDPTNIAVMLGGTGIVTRLGTKGAGATAKAIAVKAATQATEKALVRKASAAVARAEGAKAFNVTFRKAMSRAAVKAVLGKEAKQKLIATTALDTATALGVDYAYQSGMIMSGAQKEYIPLQSGLTALGALGGGMIQGAMSGLSKVSTKATGDLTNIVDRIEVATAALPSTPKAAAQQAAQSIVTDLDFAFKTIINDPLTAMAPWKGKVARGKATAQTGNFGDLSSDSDFWAYMILGNKDAGVKGLAESLLSAGVTIPAKTNTDDGIMDFLSNVIRQVPTDYLKQMQDSFVATVGKNLPDYKQLTPLQFGDMIAEKFSSYGRGLNVASQARKLSNNYVQPTAGNLVQTVSGKLPTVAKGTWDKMGYIQSLFLRAVTSHPATTMLNAKGHLAMIALDDMSDVLRGIMHTGFGFFSASQKEQGKAIRKSLQFRLATYLDPKATKQAYDGIIASHPDLLNKMMRYQTDGSDLIGIGEDFEKQFGFKLEDTKFLKYGDKAVNAAQTIWLGKALDGYTKAMAFVPNLDKHMRLKYGSDVGILEFYQRPDLIAKMRTQEYVDVMASSYEDTMRMLMSLPAPRGKDAGPLQQVAAFIEGLSQVPFIGTAIPFGRFFNNTIRVMSDYTGFGATSRLIALAANGAKKATLGGADLVGTSERPTAELITRGVVGVSLMMTLMGDYEHNLAAGLKYNQDFDEQGNIVNRQYEYPENFLRAGAAALYYKMTDAEMPEELKNEMAVAFGPGSMTRQLSDQETGLIGTANALLDAVNDPTNVDVSIKKALKGAFDTFGVGYVSGMMRPIDPVNQAAAMYRGDEYAAIDRKQGMESLNNSLRYVDQIFAVLTETATGTAVDLAPAKRVATRQGDIQLQPTQVIGRRTLPPMTITEKIFNQVGRELYKTGVKSPIPAANNAVNEVVAPFLEYRMELLDKSNTFKDATLEKKQDMVTKALAAAKADALEALRGSIVVEDQHVANVFDLTTKFNKKKVDAALKYFNESLGGRGLYDLSDTEIDMLKTYLEVKDQYLEAP